MFWGQTHRIGQAILKSFQLVTNELGSQDKKKNEMEQNLSVLMNYCDYCAENHQKWETMQKTVTKIQVSGMVTLTRISSGGDEMWPDFFVVFYHTHPKNPHNLKRCFKNFHNTQTYTKGTIRKNIQASKRRFTGSLCKRQMVHKFLLITISCATEFELKFFGLFQLPILNSSLAHSNCQNVKALYHLTDDKVLLCDSLAYSWKITCMSSITTEQ